MSEDISRNSELETGYLSDNDLVKKIVESNNTHLFAILYDRYSGFVYNRCLLFVKIKEEAEDLTHDIFIKLFVKLRTFKGNSKFSSWLYSFVYNHCVNYVTRDKHKKSEVATGQEYLFDLGDSSDDEEYSDEGILELKSNKLAKALQIISPQERMLLLLKYQEDFTIKELQQALNIKESAVKMRLKRAKARLVQICKTL